MPEQPIDAYASFQEAQRYGPDPIGPTWYERADEYLQALRGRLAFVELTCTEPNATITFDGKPMLTCPGTRPVVAMPGGHQVEASKPRYESVKQDLVLDPGQEERVSIEPRLPEYLDAERYWPSWVPWTIGGVGVLIAGGALSMQRTSSGLFDEYDSDINTLCEGPIGCQVRQVRDETQRKLNQAERWQWGARAGYTLSATIIIGGGVMLFLNRERLVRRRGLSESPTTSTATTITPLFTSTSAGMQAQVRF